MEAARRARGHDRIVYATLVIVAMSILVMLVLLLGPFR
jgi:hypothetical protein